MVCHTLDMNFKTSGRRNIMDNANLLASFFQHLTLLNVDFTKAFISTGLHNCFLIISRITAPICQSFDIAQLAFFRSLGKSFRTTVTTHQLAANGSKAKTTAFFRTEDDYLHTAFQLNVLQHIQCFQRTNYATHSIVHTTVNYSIKMGTRSNSRKIVVFALTTQEHITNCILTHFQT